jgi:hypothetical protein
LRYLVGVDQALDTAGHKITCSEEFTSHAMKFRKYGREEIELEREWD